MDDRAKAHIRQLLERHEGRVRHAYQDHLGFWTIGIGRLIDERRGGGLSDDEIDYLLSNDIARVTDDLPRRLPFWHSLTESQQIALVSMAFQLGVSGLMNFRKMLAALGRGDIETARAEALDSRWAQQTPGRARDVVGLL